MISGFFLSDADSLIFCNHLVMNNCYEETLLTVLDLRFFFSGLF